jgi:predicted dehydrogenase
MVGHTFEYNAAVWKARELIQSGELGNVHFLDSARLNLGLYQPDVNVIWDLAPHDISIANHLLQARPSHVHAWGSRHAQPTLVDVAHLHLDYSDLGVGASIHVSWLDPCKVRRTTVVGDRKMLVYNDMSDSDRVRIFDKGVVPTELGPVSYRLGDMRAPHITFHEPLAFQDRHFIECVSHAEEPATGGEVGRNVVAVLEAAQRSLAESRRVEIDWEPADLEARLSLSVGS